MSTEEEEGMNGQMDKDTGGAAGGVMSGQVIVDGLLCSVARAISRKASLEELSEAIIREFGKEEIQNAWTVRFTHFSSAWCKQRNKPVIQVARTELRLFVKDIVDQLVEIDTSGDNMRILCMPWYYTVKELETDSESRANLMVKESANHVDDKLEAMDQRLNKKSQEMFASIKAMVEGMVKTPSASYAGVAAPGAFPVLGQQQQAVYVQGPHGAGGAGGGQQAQGQQLRGAGRSRQRGLQAPVNTIREKSPSIKRVKLDDGTTLDVVQDRSSSKTRSNPKRAITGTSNANITGRKMRSPPADIFIYGVHPDTSEEDIVNDLADSGIVIEAKDVIKKSKDEAHLKSFKISVKAEDLQKALNPSVWPMRVKVREFIYYSKRNPRQDVRDAGQAGGAGQHHGGQADEQAVGRGQQGHSAESGTVGPGPGGQHAGDDQWQGVPLQNRFAALPSAPAEQDL